MASGCGWNSLLAYAGQNQSCGIENPRHPHPTGWYAVALSPQGTGLK